MTSIGAAPAAEPMDPNSNGGKRATPGVSRTGRTVDPRASGEHPPQRLARGRFAGFLGGRRRQRSPSWQRRRRLFVGPVVDDPAVLHSLVARLAHYLSHVDIERIVIATTQSLADDAATALDGTDPPAGIDPEAVGRIGEIRSRITFATSISTARTLASTSDVMAFWDADARRVEPWRSMSRTFRSNRTLFDIDWRRTRTDGSQAADIALLWSRPSRAADTDESERFLRRTEHLRGSTKAYLVATGPSARHALDMDLGDGVRILCNTAILDDELMAHVRPDIVTFADPIFHFGPSTYAHAFRRVLTRQAERLDFTIVTVERFAPLLRSQLPALADRVIGVRMGGPTWSQNFDLVRQLAVRPYPNILTMLMLPLAATFSRSIGLIGFDGRAPGETYFWRHGTTVQFDRELEEIRLAHPGFFELDYGDYYDEHVVRVEQLFLDIEVRGGSVESLTPSFMLPLRRRASPAAVGTGDDIRPRPPAASPTVISLSPDWTGDFGHFGPWERAIGNAARAAGYEYRTLASRANASQDSSVIPTFTHGTLHREISDASRFADELRRGLQAAVGCGRAIVCFYAADVWHLPSILEIAGERPTTTFVVNLMRAHAVLSPQPGYRPSPAMRLLAKCLDTSDGTNVHICLDTAAAVDDLRRSIGRAVLVWPMAVLADLDLMRDFGHAERCGPIRFVAPVQAHASKGFALVAELANRLSAQLRSGALELTARFGPQPVVVGARTNLSAESFRSAGGSLVTGHLNDGQYAALLGGADIVIVPYSLVPFRTRTSGVMLDAVAAGKPVVAARGTWAGDLIERQRIGVTFDDDDADALEAAVREVIADLASTTRRLACAGPRLLDDFRPARVVRFLADLAAIGNPRPVERRLHKLRSFADRTSTRHWQADVKRNDDRIDRLVHQDDLQRARDDELDHAQLLRQRH